MAQAKRDRFPWEAYVSCACAGLFAVVSAYRAIGGVTGPVLSELLIGDAHSIPGRAPILPDTFASR